MNVDILNCGRNSLLFLFLKRSTSVTSSTEFRVPLGVLPVPIFGHSIGLLRLRHPVHIFYPISSQYSSFKIGASANLSSSFMKLYIVAVFLSIAAHTLADHYVWEPARPDNCRGAGIRQHTSTIKLLAAASISDSVWMYYCMSTSAIINDQKFDRPSRCELSHSGLPRVGEFDVFDASCEVNYEWLWEKVGKIIGKSMTCFPNGEKIVFDGCTVPFSDSVSRLGKDYLNAACVAHDLCYTTPASLGITKAKCDKLVHDLAVYRCKEVDKRACYTCAGNWYGIPIRDWLFDDWKLSQTSYDEGQNRTFNPCQLTSMQRKSTLYQGSQMNIGDVRWSPSGSKLLALLGNGDLVLYEAYEVLGPNLIKIWSSNTPDIGVTKAVMQADGNFVLYTAKNIARWHTGTDYKPTNFLLLQDSGLAIYSMGHPTVQWSSDLHNGYLIPTSISTKLNAESSDSHSIEPVGTMTMQEALSETPVDIVHLDHDPNSASDYTSNHRLDGDE
jgi:hypothetical protein